MKNLIKNLWNRTKEYAARVLKRQQPVIVVTRVIYMWRPSLTIRRTRIDAAVAAAAGQLMLF